MVDSHIRHYSRYLGVYPIFRHTQVAQLESDMKGDMFDPGIWPGRLLCTGPIQPVSAAGKAVWIMDSWQQKTEGQTAHYASTRSRSLRDEVNQKLVGGLEHFIFFHILGRTIPTDLYFSEGLKPPTRKCSLRNSCCFYVAPQVCNGGIYGDLQCRRLQVAPGKMCMCLLYLAVIILTAGLQCLKKITSLRMIPTMTFIHFLTGKSSGILSDISSGILSGISSGICSGISSGILSGKSSGILSGISSGILSGISSGIFFGILSGISSDILSDIYSDILSGISSDILSGISSDILSDILSGILSGISSDILSDIFSDILPVEVWQCPLRSGSRGWGPAVPTAIWKSRLRSGSAHCDLEVAVEVRQCPLRSGSRVRQCPLRSGSRGWGPAVPTAIWKSRLRSGSAHCDLEVAVEVRQCPLGSATRSWGPAVPTGIWSSRLRSGSAHWDLQLAVEVRQCPLGSGARGGGPAVPTGIWTARRRRRVRRRRRRIALIKSNNPHLAGGEQWVILCGVAVAV